MSIVAPWRIVIIGNNPVELLDYILAIENELGIKAKNMLPCKLGMYPLHIVILIY